MKKLFILLVLSLCLLAPETLLAQVLTKKVSVEYRNVTIEEVLKDLNKKYGVQFSYSSNVVPVKQKVNLTLKDKTLKQVLDELFKVTDIDFQEVGNHIVLKKNPAKKPVKSENKNQVVPEKEMLVEEEIKEEQTVPEIKEEVVYAADTVVFFTEEDFQTLNPPDTIDKESLRKRYLQDRRKLKQQYYNKLDSMNQAEGGKSRNYSRLKKEFRRMADELDMKVDEFQERHNFGKYAKPDSIEKKEFDSDSLIIKNEIVAEDSSLTAANGDKEEELDQYEYKPAQFTFITPIGTNGTRDYRTVNSISFNLLAGRSAGLEGFEFGGILNLEHDYVWGAQFAGIGNIVRNDVRGIQFGGLMNLNGGNTQGGQFAGFMNMVTDNVFAVQGAGFMNLVSGNCIGTQFAGFMNTTGGRVNGMQAAGFMNLVGNEVKGGQVAGFMNIAGGGVDGAQVAGFMNVAADTVQGVQIAGFLNAADVVTGSQIGFFNFADSVTGAQFGFFSFARRGYRRLELWGGETLYGNLAFKTGSRYFYNIFAGSARPEGDDIYWALGYGFGGEVSLSKKFKMNIDVLAFNIHRNTIEWKELNLLNQFRPTLGYMLGKKTSVFAGPTFNVMVSDHYDSEKNIYGSPITPSYAFFNKTDNKINVAMWIGWNAGIRF